MILDRQLYLDSGNITQAKLEEFTVSLKKVRPKIIQAYANSLAMFVRYLHDRQIQPYQPEAIITSAEVLEPSDRILIEKVFGCPIFNRYGCREVSVIASECPEHDGMHIMAEGLYVEVVNGNRREAGGTGPGSGHRLT